MATITKGKTFVNGELVTPEKIHQLVDSATVANITNADIASNAAIADTKLAQISTAGKVLPAAVQGTAVITSDSRLSDARPPTTHTHDDRYYTETEVNTLLAGKQASGSYAASSHSHAATDITSGTLAIARIPTGTTATTVCIGNDSRLSDARTPTTHTHDDRYYTEAEIDTKLSGLPVSGHNHDDRYYTEAEIDTKLSGHNHDDRYYTETEVNNLLVGKQAAGSYAPATGIAPSAITGTAVITTDLRLVPAGAVMPFAMNSAPSGWLAADGLAVSRATYAALFAAIGTTYGAGDGNTTFTLPDLRGYFVRGSGTNSDGVASGTFGAKQADGVISHTHSGTTGNDSPDHTHTTQPTGGAGGTGINAGTGGAYSGTNTGGASTRHQHPFTTSSQSPAGTTETRPKNIAMMYCIKT